MGAATMIKTDMFDCRDALNRPGFTGEFQVQ